MAKVAKNEIKFDLAEGKFKVRFDWDVKPEDWATDLLVKISRTGWLYFVRQYVTKDFTITIKDLKQNRHFFEQLLSMTDGSEEAITKARKFMADMGKRTEIPSVYHLTESWLRAYLELPEAEMDEESEESETET
jgi:hypothetical protein